MPNVIEEARDGVVIARIERPPVNALDVETLNELSDLFDDLTEREVDAVVLTGSGSIFSAGADLRKVLEADPQDIAEGLDALTRCFRTLFVFQRPLVAAVNGHALAGGAVLTCACDHRVMGTSGLIGAVELKAGVPFPAWALEVIRYGANNEHVAEIVNFGRMYEPLRALDVGLVDEVSEGDVLERAIEAARELAAVPRNTFAITKRGLREKTVRAADALAHVIDDDVKAAWSSPEVLDAIRKQLASLR
jgi:enoyl-CoA hydratase